MELEDLDGVVNLQPAFAKATEGSPRLHPRSSLLRQSNRFGCEGQKLRGIRRRGIRRVTYEMLFVKHEGNFAVCVCGGTIEERTARHALCQRDS